MSTAHALSKPSRKRQSRWATMAAIVAGVVAVALVAATATASWLAAHRYVEPPLLPRPAAHTIMRAPGEGEAIPNVAATLDAAAKDPAVGDVSGVVIDALTGEELWAKHPERPLVPASAMKVYTAAAAWLSLPHDARLATRVFRGADPAELVLRSEGDITLTRDRATSLFQNNATIAELAKQLQSNGAGRGIKRIVVDNSGRSGDLFNDSWDRADIAGGNVAPLDSVMLDAARLNPSQSDSPRSAAPAVQVAQVLAAAIDSPGAKIRVSPEPVNVGEQVAEVFSAPLNVRLRDMLVHSDNLLAEAIGREIAAAKGTPTTFRGATEATAAVLAEANMPPAVLNEAVLYDNSGMSANNRLTTRGLAALLADPRLVELLDSLPISGAEGTLTARFREEGVTTPAAGWARAKTGTLPEVNALAGTVTTAQGRPLLYAFLSPGTPPLTARPGLDRLVAALYNAPAR